MARDTGRTGRDGPPAQRPTIADMFEISVRAVGDSAATSDDGNWDAAEATLASAFTAVPVVAGPEGVAERELLARRRIELFAVHCADERYGEAAAVGEEIVAYHRRYYGGYHSHTVRWTGRLGEAYLRSGDPGRAVPLISSALTALESLRGDDDPETSHYRLLYAAARAQHRPEDVP